MTLREYAKSIRLPLFIELRPADDVIVSFGLEVDLKNGSTIHRIHGRGINIEDAVASFVSKIKGGNLVFSKDFEVTRCEKVPADLLGF